ncbi:MAG: hypothetical protein QW304_02305 [Thermoproteota archaeon]
MYKWQVFSTIVVASFTSAVQKGWEKGLLNMVLRRLEATAISNER